MTGTQQSGRVRLWIALGILVAGAVALLVRAGDGELARRRGELAAHTKSLPASDQQTVSAGGPRSDPARPVLWVLAAGVSLHSDPALRLRFAAADAQGLADVLVKQRGGPLYSDVRTKVLLDGAATRAAILEALGDGFLGEAAPIDVGVVYLAGHGVREAGLGSYYFLAAAASATDPLINGLDMVEFDRQLRRTHRNLRRLVVVLDTCHAGGVAAERGKVRFGEDLAATLAPSEGLYILAAARAGERSLELPDLAHGAFTSALIDGLAGAAANPAGIISLFGLAAHAARVVPERTGGAQHPYQAIVGEDLPLAADLKRRARITPPPLPSPAPSAVLKRRARIAVMDFENLRLDPEHDWMKVALREEFTTTLNAVTQLAVYAEPEVRFLGRNAPSRLEAARRADMTRVVSGTFAVQGEHIGITAHVKDVRTLRHIASAKIEGKLHDFFVLRSRIVTDLLRQLRVELPSEEARQMLTLDSTDLAARKLLFDAESARHETGAPPSPTPAPDSDQGASLYPRMLWWLDPAAETYAADAVDAEVELRAALEAYRRAFEQKDIDALAEHYVVFSETQKVALTRYYENASALTVEFTDLRIAVIDERASVSFTRRDRFIDRTTGKKHQLIVRLTKIFVRGAGRWRIEPEQ